jgi:hypothetical protein
VAAGQQPLFYKDCKNFYKSLGILEGGVNRKKYGFKKFLKNNKIEACTYFIKEVKQGINFFLGSQKKLNFRGRKLC